jgi:hypothetical protein
MGINQITPMAEIERYLHEQIVRRERAIIYNLSYVGEQCVNQARSAGSYTDQTGNLRSSTGYVIAMDGRIVQSGGFEVVKTGGTGASNGKAFANQLVSQFPNDVVLIVVAGMNYAAEVSARGKDVIDSAELLAQRLVPQVMKKLKL